MENLISMKYYTFLFFRNLKEMAQYADTSEVFLDAVESVPGGPVGSQTRVNLRNEHMSYILTW